MSQQPDAPDMTAAMGDGALLLDIYRRLVPLHATLTEHGARRPDVPRVVAADLMEVLGTIEASPSFQVAADAERRVKT